MAAEPEDMCMSCFRQTKYACIRCELPICNVCSVPELDEEIPGWASGEKVAYCEPCFKELKPAASKVATSKRQEGQEKRDYLKRKRYVKPITHIIYIPFFSLDDTPGKF
ncbi:hypothetical protein OS493_000548 [Desmophyllum pertusum]|uniref:Zinc finger protein n=1 Tax=Desmophyllum pertusum TaxID=174260 RepID=A0A9X0DBS0_9CNID|nr:hypothetical protein OS493_000548 [Desmophyllum pertusum]